MEKKIKLTAYLTIEERNIMSCGDWTKISMMLSDLYQKGDLTFENE